MTEDAATTTVERGEPLLEIEHIAKSYSGLKALDDVTFSVSRGEIAALIGPNGAGKTTMFDIITGFTRPDRGRVVFAGDDITRTAPHRLASRGLVRSFQTAKMFPSMTVEEIVLTASMLKNDRKTAKGKVEKILTDIELTAKARSYASELSLPDRQMVELSKCVALEPTMILLDEIMGGLNRAEAETPIAAIRTLRDQGLTFLLVEHVMPIVMSLCEHIAVLDFGRCIATGTPQQIAVDPDVQRSYLGGTA
ncbi:ABC transporter ATP-binding protein [Brevibacterium atlanticum]|uniref:ABC transporter ATP-binding protein n=1 Tax=Brevibacterium atlanticum TaxID=2697563 RepID=UPI00141FE522|nr:ABC transporter ATP-binding protein [Brevibacterium atlanticum]